MADELAGSQDIRRLAGWLKRLVTRVEKLERDQSVGGAGVTDHGLLTGLADDDHPQYTLSTELDTHKTSTDHDSRYYTETEIDTSLALKANLASPTFTGDPKAPTPAVADNDTSIATTEWVNTALGNPSTARPSARVYHSTTQSIPDVTDTALTFDSERYDNEPTGMHEAVTNPTRLTCVNAGIYVISASATFAANATGVRTISFRLNGTTLIDERVIVAAAGGSATRMGLTTQYQLAANDYVEVIVRQNSTAALNITSVANISPEFSMSFVGSGSAVPTGPYTRDQVHNLIENAIDDHDHDQRYRMAACGVTMASVLITAGGVLTFSSARFDNTHRMWLSTAATRVTIQDPGVYQISCSVQPAAGAGGSYRYIAGKKNGTEISGLECAETAASTVVDERLNCSLATPCVAGDYIELYYEYGGIGNHNVIGEMTVVRVA